MGSLRALPLTTGPLGWALGAALAALLVWLLARRFDAARLLVALGVACGLVVAARAALPGSVDVARIPTSFVVWSVVVLGVAAYVVSLWRGAGRRWRVGGAVAVVTAGALAAQQVNAWFAYYPTAADLVGLPLQGQTRLADLARLDAAARTAAFPDGALVSVELPATRSAFAHRPALVWLPPAALAAPGPLGDAGDGGRRAVVLLLAGTPGAPDDMVRAGNLDRVAAAYAAQHGGQAPILVMADHNGSFAGDSECVGAGGRAETYLTDDVPAALAARFDTRRSGWGVLGYSEGGTCALVLALRHPALFPAFVDIAGDLRPNLGEGPQRQRAALVQLYGGSEAAAAGHDPLTLLHEHRYEASAGWFVAGRGDAPAMHAEAELAPAARRSGMAVVTSTPRGHHSFSTVNAVTPACFAWLAGRLANPTFAEGAPGSNHA